MISQTVLIVVFLSEWACFMSPFLLVLSLKKGLLRWLYQLVQNPEPLPTFQANEGNSEAFKKKLVSTSL
jgi:hypothetical protein